jgi:hypothetical protein
MLCHEKWRDRIGTSLDSNLALASVDNEVVGTTVAATVDAPKQPAPHSGSWCHPPAPHSGSWCHPLAPRGDRFPAAPVRPTYLPPVLRQAVCTSNTSCQRSKATHDRTMALSIRWRHTGITISWFLSSTSKSSRGASCMMSVMHTSSKG